MIEETTRQATRPPASSTPAGSGLAVGQFFAALIALIALLGLLWLGFVYLRGATSANLLNAAIAILWGVGGVAALFFVTNTLIEALPSRQRDAARPFLFF